MTFFITSTTTSSELLQQLFKNYEVEILPKAQVYTCFLKIIAQDVEQLHADCIIFKSLAEFEIRPDYKDVNHEELEILDSIHRIFY